MSTTTPETTFKHFTPTQAHTYASTRGQLSYPPQLYTKLLTYHTSLPTNRTKTFLDVGTGTGKVVSDLLEKGHFQKGIGCDASVGMVEQARRGAEEKGLQAKFVVKKGEECGDLQEGEKMGMGKVDMVTVAMAAHWFSLPSFYASAASILKPSGTLALWTCVHMFVHPSQRNAATLQRILFNLDDNLLKPFEEPGNALSRGGYSTLPLPWDFAECKGLFDEGSFERVEWDKDGVPSAPPGGDGSPGPFVVISEPIKLSLVEMALGSSSMVIRWREANPELAGGDEDPVKVTMKRLREANAGEEQIYVSASLHLLLMRRSKK